MALEQKDYEELRDKCIQKFKILYKDAVVFDYCEVPKDIRIRLLNDPYYISKTKALRASLFAQQLETLDAVLAGAYGNPDKPTDQSATVLKALEMKQKLLLEDLNINKDDSNALNIAFTAMSKEDFEALETVEERIKYVLDNQDNLLSLFFNDEEIEKYKKGLKGVDTDAG